MTEQERTAAQKRFMVNEELFVGSERKWEGRCAGNMARGAMDRAEEVDQRVTALAAEVQRLFEKLDGQRNWLESIGQDVCAQADRLTALEQPATAAPDPVCAECDHPQSKHFYADCGGEGCTGTVPYVTKSGESVTAWCPCAGFVPVPTEQPAPLDPVPAMTIKDAAGIAVRLIRKEIGEAYQSGDGKRYEELSHAIDILYPYSTGRSS